MAFIRLKSARQIFSKGGLMLKDPIIDEKRKVQEKTYKKCKGNLEMYCAEIKKAAEEFKKYKEKVTITRRRHKKTA